MMSAMQRYALPLLLSLLLPLLLSAQDSVDVSSWQIGPIPSELRPDWYVAPLIEYPLLTLHPVPIGYSFLQGASPGERAVQEYPLRFSAGIRFGDWVPEVEGLRLEGSTRMSVVRGVQTFEGAFRGDPDREILGVQRNEYRMLTMELGLLAGYDLSLYQLIQGDSGRSLGQWYGLVLRGGFTGWFTADMEQHVVATPDNPGELDELITRFAEEVDQSEGEGTRLVYNTPHRSIRAGLGLLIGLDVELRLWGAKALSVGVDYRYGIVPPRTGEGTTREVSLHAMMLIGGTRR